MASNLQNVFLSFFHVLFCFVLFLFFSYPGLCREVLGINRRAARERLTNELFQK